MRFHRPDGREAWGLVASAPFNDRRGNLNGVLRMVTDISEQKAAEAKLQGAIDAQRSLLDELDHRVRNNLSAILSIIQNTRVEARDLDTYVDLVSGRVGALTSAYGLLTRSARQGLPLQQLLEEIIVRSEDGRIAVDTEQCSVPSKRVVALALVMHELLAWSKHHGALARPEGRAAIHCQAIASHN